MKKVLFILGMIFSVCGFAEQGILISETDSYQDLSEKIELKKASPHIYKLKGNPHSIFGIRIDDQHLNSSSIGFDKAEKACFALVIMYGESGYRVMIDRLKGVFPIFDGPYKDKGDAYSFEDNDRFGGMIFNMQ